MKTQPVMLSQGFDGVTPPSLLLTPRDVLNSAMVRTGLVLTQTLDLSNDKLNSLNCDFHFYYETYYDKTNLMKHIEENY